MKKVKGIGGIFFKSDNPEKMRDWYNKYLGIESDKWGSVFHWREHDNPDNKGVTVWNPFPKDTKYFSPSRKSFMLNYIVEDLEGLINELRNDGIKIVGEIEVFDYGKFAWIQDPEGNKIELWEPFS